MITDENRIIINEQNLGIDLLRIFAMFMICQHHVIGHGGVIESVNVGSVYYFITLLFEVFSVCAVNCFGMISGYVRGGRKYKPISLIKIWLLALFYNVTITLIFYFLRNNIIGIKDILRACFPVSSNSYWYLSSYAIMFIFVPYMNFLLNKMDEDSLKKGIYAFFFIFSILSVIPTIPKLPKFSMISLPVNYGYSFLWLSFLYMIGGFVHLYGFDSLVVFRNNNLNNKIIMLMNTQIFRFSLYLFCIILTYLIKGIGHAIFLKSYGYDYYTSVLGS